MTDPHEKRWHVYIIECTASSGRVTIHVGIALDVEKRLGDHRGGKVKATRGRKIRLLGHSTRLSHGDALAMESMMKAMSPNEKKTWAARWKNGRLA